MIAWIGKISLLLLLVVDASFDKSLKVGVGNDEIYCLNEGTMTDGKLSCNDNKFVLVHTTYEVRAIPDIDTLEALVRQKVKIIEPIPNDSTLNLHANLTPIFIESHPYFHAQVDASNVSWIPPAIPGLLDQPGALVGPPLQSLRKAANDPDESDLDWSLP